MIYSCIIWKLLLRCFFFTGFSNLIITHLFCLQPLLLLARDAPRNAHHIHYTTAGNQFESSHSSVGELLPCANACRRYYRYHKNRKTFSPRNDLWCVASCGYQFVLLLEVVCNGKNVYLIYYRPPNLYRFQILWIFGVASLRRHNSARSLFSNHISQLRRSRTWSCKQVRMDLQTVEKTYVCSYFVHDTTYNGVISH